MADEQKTTTPDRTTYTPQPGRESVDRHRQQPETLTVAKSSVARTRRRRHLTGVVISLVEFVMVATARRPPGRRGLPQPQAKGRLQGD